MTAYQDAATVICDGLTRGGRPMSTPSFRVGDIVFLALHKRLHVLRRDQFHLVTHPGQLSRPVAGTAAGLHDDDSRWLCREKLPKLRAR